MLTQLKWPLTVIVSVCAAGYFALEIAVLVLQLDPSDVAVLQSIRAALATAAAGAGGILLPIVVQALKKDSDGDGIPDVLEGGATIPAPPEDE